MKMVDITKDEFWDSKFEEKSKTEELVNKWIKEGLDEVSYY